jgi:hypothetical protein
MNESNHPPLIEGGPSFQELWQTWKVSESPYAFAALLLDGWGQLKEGSKRPTLKELKDLWESFSSPTFFGRAVLMRWGCFDKSHSNLILLYNNNSQ